MKKTYLVLVIIFAVVIGGSLSRSLFIQDKDRVNFVIYEETPVYYSLSLKGSINYQIPFAADYKVEIPGGYSFYRLGGLGKLIQLEKKKDLYKKTFSSLTASFTDFYFYPRRIEVYYAKIEKGNIPQFDLYKLISYKSNANFFDRLYLLLRLTGKSKKDFQIIEELPVKQIGSDLVFNKKDFFKDYQGYFYQKTYRDENKTVQIIYTKSYKGALNISDLLDGNGIKVVDLTQEDAKDNHCYVIEQAKVVSRTAKDVAGFFGCSLQKEKTGVSDIIIKLGEVEKNWN